MSCGEDSRPEPRLPAEPSIVRPQRDEPWNDWGQWVEFQPGPLRDEVWDVFELDDETAEPEPEYGDFWGEVDDEEPI